MVDRMRRNGFQVETADDALLAEAEEAGKATGSSPAGGAAAPAGSDAEKQAQAAANRARMQAQNAKK
jgi:hypothetical protein